MKKLSWYLGLVRIYGNGEKEKGLATTCSMDNMHLEKQNIAYDKMSRIHIEL